MKSSYYKLIMRSLFIILIMDYYSDGSYYYSNANGSTYYNDGKGNATYTPPGGKK